MPELYDKKVDASAGDQEPQSLSLLGGVAQPDEFDELDELSGEGVSRWSGRGATVLLIVLVMVGGGLLYGMRSMQGELSDGVGDDVEDQIEAALERLKDPSNMSADDPLMPGNLAALFASTDAVVSMFAADLTERQVPIEYVKQNPFARGRNQPAQAINTTGAARQREQWRTAIEQEAGRLNLQSVTTGQGGPIAIIDGKFVRPGESVGAFRVTQINPNQLSVELVADNHEFDVSVQFTLDMQRRGGAGRRR
ncbi:MAG: hypothetical protein WD009_10530 [Phycisphaeraceae bacterium]